MTSYHYSARQVNPAYWLNVSLNRFATTTGLDRRSPFLPIYLSEATITEGSLPTGDFIPAPTSEPQPKRDVVVRTSLIASLLAREPANQRAIGVVAHISSREGWLILKGNYAGAGEADG